MIELSPFEVGFGKAFWTGGLKVEDPRVYFPLEFIKF